MVLLKRWKTAVQSSVQKKDQLWLTSWKHAECWKRSFKRLSMTRASLSVPSSVQTTTFDTLRFSFLVQNIFYFSLWFLLLSMDYLELFCLRPKYLVVFLYLLPVLIFNLILLWSKDTVYFSFFVPWYNSSLLNFMFYGPACSLSWWTYYVHKERTCILKLGAVF